VIADTIEKAELLPRGLGRRLLIERTGGSNETGAVVVETFAAHDGY
jgi:hypothetical protein